MIIYKMKLTLKKVFFFFFNKSAAAEIEKMILQVREYEKLRLVLKFLKKYPL